jgi:hypothetical protein
MHVEENLLDGIDDVRVGECQILEGPDEAPVLSRISNRRPKLSGDPGMCVHMHQNRPVVHHSSSLKDIKSKVALSEEELICLMLYRDP